MAKKRKSTIYQLSQKTEAPATQGKNYPATARVPSLDEIYDEETNTNRMIRYVIGEPSIFEDEQTSDKPVLGDIVFTNGILPVAYNQATLKKYLDTSNYNGANPNRIEDKKVLFQAIDNEFDAQKSMKDMEVEYLATDTLMKLDAQKMVGYARAMGLDVDRSMYEIKHDMMVMAKGNPKLFMDEISNPMIERKQVIMDAIDEMIVIELKGKRQFVWGDSKELIFTVPVGVDVIDALTEYTFDDEGTSVFSRIKRLMSKEDVIKTKTETKTKKVEKFVN
tara:strand:- start:22371 stop:23204 length:834 start_codon:yes stop_codon:yes gene_type:complete